MLPIVKVKRKQNKHLSQISVSKLSIGETDPRFTEDVVRKIVDWDKSKKVIVVEM